MSLRHTFQHPIENILPFFTFQSRVSDMEMIDVLDYLIIVEEKKLKDSKKKMYSREKIARLFSAELEKYRTGI